MKEKVTGELRQAFRPEFLNRIDEIIVFHPLTHDNILEIAGKMTVGVSQRLRPLEVELTIETPVLEKLAEKGFDPVYGARPLRRAIQTLLEDPIAEQMLEGKIKKGDKGRLCSRRKSFYERRRQSPLLSFGRFMGSGEGNILHLSIESKQ